MCTPKISPGSFTASYIHIVLKHKHFGGVAEVVE